MFLSISCIYFVFEKKRLFFQENNDIAKKFEGQISKIGFFKRSFNPLKKISFNQIIFYLFIEIQHILDINTLIISIYVHVLNQMLFLQEINEDILSN